MKYSVGGTVEFVTCPQHGERYDRLHDDCKSCLELVRQSDMHKARSNS